MIENFYTRKEMPEKPKATQEQILGTLQLQMASISNEQLARLNEMYSKKVLRLQDEYLDYAKRHQIILNEIDRRNGQTS